jgi:hypothetical protein
MQVRNVTDPAINELEDLVTYNAWRECLILQHSEERVFVPLQVIKEFFLRQDRQKKTKKYILATFYKSMLDEVIKTIHMLTKQAETGEIEPQEALKLAQELNETGKIISVRLKEISKEFNNA